MGRPKCFDEDKVLDLAIDCFWKHGLRASSIRTLSDEMGIAGPSLYNAYGSKQSLFTRALKRYAETFMRPRFLRVRDLPPLEAICAFLHESVELASTDPECKGCLFVNTTIETASDEDEFLANACNYLDEVRSFFTSNIQAAKDKGQLSADTNVSELAEMLFIIVIGICVRARSNPARSELEDAIAPALKLLAVKP